MCRPRRKGVQFHNGRELTSDDVRWNLLRVREPKLAAIVGSLSYQSAWWVDIQTPDNNTVILQSDASRPGLFDFFHYFNILDKDLMEGPDANTRMNGTGPLMFVEWMPGDHLSFARNPNYWMTGRPHVDGLFNQVMHDAQAMIVALEAGAIDIAHLPPVADAMRLKSNASYTVPFFDQGGSWFYVRVGVGFAATMLEQAVEACCLYRAFAEQEGWRPTAEDVLYRVPVHIGRTDTEARETLDPEAATLQDRVESGQLLVGGPDAVLRALEVFATGTRLA